ncbi:uncharacterized protein K452DRAFT_293439 [Aplosporella prunicola CBS 121167]|uniref:Nudix hydrolase domain-containing protein n=1 Tax=Aplosporella prunicola CBS 121167 TaxID=1176127 RepID=A0A6A6AVB2_9PEZI|nr:uncharacterized protein K452DRAFT_293439 [Aplosporella prunicola CBS 121167]KAF2135148.1 hypothetical protein K452DRAFT_293439 [Aplosporella prunicola CBS 121167]
MAQSQFHPIPGVAALVYNREGKILFAQRKGILGNGKWAPAGGHLEIGETFTECAEREVMEETGLRTKNHRFVGATSDMMPNARKHYVSLYVACELVDPDAQPVNMEPEKCGGFQWLSMDEVRLWANNFANEAPEWQDKRLFRPILNVLKAYPDNDMLR